MTSIDTSETSKSPRQVTTKPASAAPAKPLASGKPAPLFRPIDWFTLIIVTIVVMIGYWLTLSPDLGLEDSGELAVASLYAGIPHPPGYPVWSIYTHLWAKFLPFHNIAWRVALGGAVAGAFACGLIGLVVSRGSSMMIEGIDGLKNIDRKWENAICIVSGFVAGTLLGFNGYMWSQSVIVEVYPFSVLSLMGVLVFLLRWVYAPKQWRYLIYTFFVFGICFTNHQTLIVAAMGLVVTIAAVDYRMGRSMFLWCSISFLCGLALKIQKMIFTDTNPMVFVIFCVVGVCFIAAYVLFAILTKESFLEMCLDFCLLAMCIFLVSIPGMGSTAGILALFAFAGVVKIGWDTRKIGLEWFFVLVGCGVAWGLGAAFYLYMPLAGMSTPPMQWGYPRTLDGFIHALTRGQYEKTNPTDFLTGAGFMRFISQLGLVAEGVVAEFNWVYSLLAIVPFLFFFRMQKRERAWMIGLVAIYICLSVLLVVLLNPSLDKQTRDLTRVFFTASHVMVVIWIGYGLTLIGASLYAQYDRFRKPGLIAGGIAIALALFSLAGVTQKMSAGLEGGALGTFFPAIIRAFQPNQYGLPIYADLILLGLVIIFVLNLLLGRKKPHLGLALAVFAVMPLHSVMSHWSDNEQRGHLFGYWFGHDMFTPPFKDTDGKLSYDPKRRAELMKDPAKAKLIYPEMTRDAILYGGTDPGRFCPTYMVFCESFTPANCKPLDPLFDRRDVYVITQNALADGTYLMYIRSHYNKSTQIQYDTPFFQEIFQKALISDPKERQYRIHPISKIASNWLDKPFLALGAKIEAQRRKEGVYPMKEMYIATPEDSSQCFQEYMQDAQRRMEKGLLRPGEMVTPVRDADGQTRVQVSGQVAVMAINGLLTKVMFNKNPTNEFFVEESFPLEWMYPHLTPFGVIMKINREKLPTLTEDILNQDHQFWADYSERLIGNWITYETPIKEIADYVERVYQRRDFTGFKGDRKFVRDDQGQKAFSKLRSSIAGIYAWRLGMNGGPITDEQRRFMPKTAAERERLLKEADFAFKQAFAFCPYSPEAVFRYMQVLLQANRLEDAILVVQTAQKLDPNNDQLGTTLRQLENFRSNAPKISEAQSSIEKFQKEWKDTGNIQTALNLAGAHFSIGQNEAGITVLDEVLASPKCTAEAVVAVGQYHSQAKNISKLDELLPRFVEIVKNPQARLENVSAVIQLVFQTRNLPALEICLERLTLLQPSSAEAFFDLASLRSSLGKTNESLGSLKKCLELSDARLKTNSKATDLRAAAIAAKDQTFQPVSKTPEFKALTSRL